MDIFLLKIFQTVRIKMNQIEGLDGLDIGKSLLIEAVEPGTHGGTFLVIVAHPAKQRPGHQCTEWNTDQGKKCKGRIIIENDGQRTEKFHGVDDQVRYPVQDTTGDIGSIGVPSGHQITGVISSQRFPVRDKDF